MTDLLFLFATFAEVLALLSMLIGVLVVLVRKKRITGLRAMAIASLLLVPLVIVSQEPWRAYHIVGQRQIGNDTYVMAQNNDGGGLQEATFWFNDGNGMWRVFPVDPDTVYWRTVGFRNIASNRVDITRWGFRIATFDPLSKKLQLRGTGEPFYAYLQQPASPYGR